MTDCKYGSKTDSNGESSAFPADDGAQDGTGEDELSLDKDGATDDPDGDKRRAAPSPKLGGKGMAGLLNPLRFRM